MTPMKVAYVLHGRFPTEKAHGIQIAKLCDALTARASVTLIALALGDRAHDEEHAFALERVSVTQPLRRATRLGFLLEKCLFLRAAAKLVREGRFDLVITREPLLPYLLPRQDIALEVHDLPAKVRFYMPAMKRAKRVAVKTRALRDALVRAGMAPDRIEVIPNAVDMRDFEEMPERSAARASLGLEPGRPVVVYAGSFQPWKGVDTLIRAARRCPGVSFIVVGGTDAEVARKKESASPNVLFIGTKPHQEVVAYLAAADILALPNERGTSVSELYTSPLKLFEYMAARRPILASDLPSIREALADDEGYFFEPGDDAGMAKKVREMLAKYEAAHAWAENAYRTVAKNTWGGVAERLLGILT